MFTRVTDWADGGIPLAKPLEEQILFLGDSLNEYIEFTLSDKSHLNIEWAVVNNDLLCGTEWRCRYVVIPMDEAIKSHHGRLEGSIIMVQDSIYQFLYANGLASRIDKGDYCWLMGETRSIVNKLCHLYMVDKCVTCDDGDTSCVTC